MAALAGYKADIYVTSTPGVGFVDVTMNDDGDHKTYTISDSTKRYLDKTGTFTVETSPDGTTWTTAGATTYALQYVGGKVIFKVANAAGTHVRLSGSYLPYSELGNAHEWALDNKVTLVDASTFGTTWKQFAATQQEASAKVMRYWLDGFFASNLGADLVLVFYVDTTTGARYEAFARLAQDTAKASVNALVDEELTFTIDGAVFYVAS